MRISFAPTAGAPEQPAAFERAFAKFEKTVTQSELLWEAGSKSQNERRDACASVAIALTILAKSLPLTTYARHRFCSGRHAVLLAPAPVHPASLSVLDLVQQGTAQVCVDLLRESGHSAAEARKVTAQLFAGHKLLKFSEAKLRAIGCRLKGAGASQDPAYELYQTAALHAQSLRDEHGLESLTPAKARKFADVLVALAKRQDHRRDFFFAPGEDSTEMP